jgi:predicted GIY-YIG superfamily endonuclease
MHDKYAMTTDRVFCDPQLRAEFDRVAQAAAPGVSAYQLRKATLRLRKNRQLKPELIVRVADWGREILTFPAAAIVKSSDVVPTNPGIYIFRDDSGYLYIGESHNLRSRVEKHLDHSDRKSLAHYLWENGNTKITVELHSFDPVSKASDKMVRRAYESELIRSREPRFNIAP